MSLAMIRAILKTIVFFVSSFVSLANASQLYVLTKPITQTTKMSKTWMLASLAADTAWEVGKGLGILYFTGNPHLAAATALQGLTAEPFTYPVFLAVEMKSVAQFKRRKSIGEIANLPEVKRIHVLTAGKLETPGLTNITLHSKSVVFIETDGPPPEGIAGGDWMPLKRITFRLKIRGNTFGAPLVLTDTDILQKDAGDPTITREWIRKINRWRRTFPIWRRILPHNGIDHGLAIEAFYQIGEKEISLGDYTTGTEVRKVLRSTWTARIVGRVRSFFSTLSKNPPMKLIPTDIDVADKKAPLLSTQKCSELYGRLAGKLYIRHH